jgi:hypothetical protein
VSIIVDLEKAIGEKPWELSRKGRRNNNQLIIYLNMESILKIFSIILIVVGVLAILGSLSDNSLSGIVGGTMFLVEGILALAYIGECKEVKK